MIPAWLIEAGAFMLIGTAAVTGGVLYCKHPEQVGYDRGHAAAVEGGRKQRERDGAAALTTERSLRANLADADARPNRRSKPMPKRSLLLSAVCALALTSCAAPQPAVQSAAAAPAGFGAGGPSPVGPGSAVMPEVAGDILRLTADTGRVVRNYQRVVERLGRLYRPDNQTK